MGLILLSLAQKIGKEFDMPCNLKSSFLCAYQLNEKYESLALHCNYVKLFTRNEKNDENVAPKPQTI